MYFDELQTLLISLTNCNITFSDMAEALGRDRSNITYKINKKVQVKDSELLKISEHFNIPLEKLKAPTTNVAKEEFVSIPVYGDVSASCGYGAIIDNESQTAIYPIAAPLLKFLGANEKCSQIIFATGDSMKPEIKHGDALMVDTSKKEIVDGQIYIIRYDSELMCKRLQKLPPNRIKVISDNPKYESYTIETDSTIDFEIIGRVLYYSRVAR